MWENVRILVVAKNQIKNRKNVRTTVVRGARMILIAKNAPYTLHRTRWPLCFKQVLLKRWRRLSEKTTPLVAYTVGKIVILDVLASF